MSYKYACVYIVLKYINEVRVEVNMSGYISTYDYAPC
jgi:hypothetical protein